MKPAPDVTDKELKEIFNQNFEHLRAENGHSLSPEVREAAWQQVRLYWFRLRHIAEAVTDTEVELSLPNQKTPKGRLFCIKGVVDIVRENDRVTMYEIKTHDLAFVRSNIKLYEDQLNVYAHIWQQLRGQRLDEAAIITTPPPDKVLDAVRTGEPSAVEAACCEWDPVVPIPFDAKKVKKTADQFARVVDAIEDNEFGSPALEILQKKNPDGRTFAQRVCRNCDVRFSCSSFHSYARKHKDRKWETFAAFYDIPTDESEELQRTEISIDSVASAMEAAEDL